MNNKKHITLISLVLALTLLSSCKEQTSNAKFILNEVLVCNQTNYQDDYGLHCAWVEVFNKSYSVADLAGFYLKCSNQPGDTIGYFIPKGDVLTQVKPRQHALFWADGQPNKGTFHTNFTLERVNNLWIGLYNSGNKLIDQIIVPAEELGIDQSYARVNDGTAEWEIKTGSDTSYVTPSTNNKTIDSNAKSEKFKSQDRIGLGMAISAMSVVFCGLLLLFVVFKSLGRFGVSLLTRKAMKVEGLTDKKEVKGHIKAVPGEVYAAIGLALHEFQSNVHDVEETILTITPVKRTYSPWSSKIYSLRTPLGKK